MVDLAENWAEQYLQVTDNQQHPSTSDAQARDMHWTQEYLSSDIPNVSSTGELQWAKDYLEQNEHKLWYIVTHICIMQILVLCEAYLYLMVYVVNIFYGADSCSILNFHNFTNRANTVF